MANSTTERITRLREALRTFAGFADFYDRHGERIDDDTFVTVTMRALRKARAVYEETRG